MLDLLDSFRDIAEIADVEVRQQNETIQVLRKYISELEMKNAFLDLKQTDQQKR